MSYRTGPKIVTDGLVCCLDAADRNSYPGTGTTWYDLSGNGNNGTFNGNTSFSSVFCGSISFDGNGDYVTIPNSSSLSPTTGITIFSWTKSSAYGNMTIVGKNNSFQNQTFANNGIENSINAGGWAQPRTASGILSTSNWNNIVNTYTTNDYVQRTYLNASHLTSGQLPYTRTGSIAANINVYNEAVYIGSWRGGSEYFNGLISVIILYNRALSAEEILQNYNATKGRFGL